MIIIIAKCVPHFLSVLRWCYVQQRHVFHLVVFSPSLYGATYSNAMFTAMFPYFFFGS